MGINNIEEQERVRAQIKEYYQVKTKSSMFRSKARWYHEVKEIVNIDYL